MARQRRLQAVLLVLSLWVPSAQAGLASPPPPGPHQEQPDKAEKLSRDWKRIRTANFEAATNAPTEDVVKVLDQLEVFRGNLVTRFLSLRTSAPLPTLVVVFRGDGAFARFKPRDEKGRKRDFVGAYFLQGPDMNHIVLPKAQGQDLRTIFHEYYHYVAHRNRPNVPTWLDEGLADYYSTSEFDPSKGQSIIGKVIPVYIQWLRAESLIPLAQLLSAEGAGKILRGTDQRRIAVLYAESWALVHYLMLADNAARAPRITTYLQALEKGLPLEAAFRSAFGLTYEEATKELSAYIGRNAFPMMTVTQSEAGVAAGSAASSMTEAEAECLQGDLLVRIGAQDDGEKTIAKALALDPAYLPAKVALARVRLEQHREAEAVEMLRPAAAGAPGDFAVHVALGLAYLRVERNDEALGEFKRAAALNGAATSAWSGVAQAALAAGRLQESDEALERLQQLEPGAHWYQARGYAAFAAGDFSVAARDARSYVAKAGRGAESAPYMAFLGAISLWRLDRASEADALLADVLPDLSADSWPATVMEFMQGKLPADRFLALAKDIEQQTEAHAYVGFKALQAGRRDEALSHLRWVKERGTSTFVEHQMAVAELKRLEKGV